MYRLTFAVAALAFLPNGVAGQNSDETALVKGLFAQIQPLSIEENREYCGYVGLDVDGVLFATEPKRGRTGSCLPNDPDELEVVFASYHTHGAFSPDYFNEVPSVDDMEGDEAEDIDGWVATPGGRLWYIDSVDMIASQVCGLGCLVSDSNFVAGDMGGVQDSYSYDELVEALDELDAD